MTKRIIKRITKPITLALAMIGLSATAFAGAPGNNMVAPTGTPVIAPDSMGTWSFGLEALYMQSNTNFQYADTGNSTLLGGSGVINNESVTNEWNWGVEGDISYMFPGSSRDVSASYTHLNLDGNDSVSSPANVSGVVGLSGPVTDYDSAKGTSDQTLNAATLTFGQLLTVGDRLSLHPFGGLAYADIDSTNKANYFTLDNLTESYKGTSDFQGIGPRAGMDAAVHLGSGFSIVGTMAGDLLVGSMDSKFNFNQALSGVTNQFKNDSYTQVVPELDAKLGIDYMYAFNPNTSMNVQLGYQVVNYFNAESQDTFDSVITNSTNNTNDFDYNGPYLRLQLNVA